MKLTIGTNIFGKYARQDIAIEMLLRLKEEFEINLVNACFAEDEHLTPVGFTKKILCRSARDFISEPCKKLPIVTDVFDSINEESEEYFLFVNSDIVVKPSFIKTVLKNNPLCFACNRIDTHPFSSLEADILPIRMEIGGFDAFGFSKEVYKSNKHLFGPFLLGAPWFDHHFAGIIFSLGGGLYNTGEIIHQDHPKNWSDHTVEAKYNANLFNTDPYRPLSYSWDEYFASYLKHKRQMGFILSKDEEERQKEKEFLENAKNNFNQFMGK